MPVKESTLMALFTSHVEAILRDGATIGRLAAARTSELARFFIGAMKAYHHWVLEGDGVSDADFFVDTFLHGALAAREAAAP